MPALAAARMQRYALQLAAYSYDVELRRSQDVGVADVLSRLPMPGIVDKGAKQIEEEARTSNVLFLDEGPAVTASEIATATRCDAVLGKVLAAISSGVYHILYIIVN